MNVNSFRKQLNSEQVRHADMAASRAQETVLKGRFNVNNTGEAYKSVVFPVAFSTLPLVTFGFEVNTLDSIVQTRAPKITAQVYDWQYTERLPTSRIYYGAKFLVVSEGAMVSAFTVTWQASGIAFSGPRS